MTAAECESTPVMFLLSLQEEADVKHTSFGGRRLARSAE